MVCGLTSPSFGFQARMRHAPGGGSSSESSSWAAPGPLPPKTLSPKTVSMSSPDQPAVNAVVQINRHRFVPSDALARPCRSQQRLKTQPVVQTSTSPRIACGWSPFGLKGSEPLGHSSILPRRSLYSMSARATGFYVDIAERGHLETRSKRPRVQPFPANFNEPLFGDSSEAEHVKRVGSLHRVGFQSENETVVPGAFVSTGEPRLSRAREYLDPRWKTASAYPSTARRLKFRPQLNSFRSHLARCCSKKCRWCPVLEPTAGSSRPTRTLQTSVSPLC